LVVYVQSQTNDSAQKRAQEELKNVNLNEQVAIESLLLANHVELADGRLYVSGGGWNTFHRLVPQGEGMVVNHLGVAVVVAIPWHQTNMKRDLILELRDEDAKIIASNQTHIDVGRPAGLRHGQIQYASLAWSLDLVFPHAGCYEVVARIEDVEGSERRWTFQVQDIRLAAAA